MAAPGAQRRDLSGRELFSLAFGAIVGVSWIVLVGQWISDAGSVGAMLAFLIGGLLILPIGQIYAELGQKMPATGGEFVYAYSFFGPRAAFLVGWIIALFYTSICAFEAVSSAWLIGTILPEVRGPVVYTFAGEAIHAGDMMLGIGFSIALLILQLRGAQLTAQVQDVMVLILVGLAVIFVMGSVWSGSIANATPLFGDSGPKFLALLLATPLFYAGFGAVPQALGESSENARRKLPMIIAVTLIASMLFKIGVILATALVLSPADALASEFPVAEAFKRAFGSEAMVDLALFAGLLGLLTTWNATFFAANRVLFAIGNAGVGPQWLGKTDARTGVPRRAVLIVFVCTLLVVPFGKQMLIPIITLGGIAVTLIFSIMAFCLLRLRRDKGEGLGLPIIGCVIAVGLLGLNVVQMAQIVGGGRYVEVIALAFWIVSGLAVWFGSSGTRSRMSKEERDARIFGEQAA
jgi:APA family basic amino acid/polyamine antiporter